MKTTIKISVCLLACFIFMQSVYAKPCKNNGSCLLRPDNDPVTIGGNHYEYVFDMSYLGGKPASFVLPAEFSNDYWSVGEGITGFAATQLKNAWSFNSFTANRKAKTPALCIDMGEHYFIAQFYEGAPGQYGAMVMGQDGYFHDVYSFFCEMLSSQEYKCYGLPVESTKKTTVDGINFYTLKVQTDPCYGSKISVLYFFPTVIPASLKSGVFVAGSCGAGDIYIKE